MSSRFWLALSGLGMSRAHHGIPALVSAGFQFQPKYWSEFTAVPASSSTGVVVALWTSSVQVRLAASPGTGGLSLGPFRSTGANSSSATAATPAGATVNNTMRAITQAKRRATMTSIHYLRTGRSAAYPHQERFTGTFASGRSAVGGRDLRGATVRASPAPLDHPPLHIPPEATTHEVSDGRSSRMLFPTDQWPVAHMLYPSLMIIPANCAYAA